MPMFGFSAYIKLVCLNSRPQRTEIRKRLQPSRGGYDFHRSLRLLARRYILDGESLIQISQSIEQIYKEAERNSARAGIAALSMWRASNLGELIEFPPVTYESPRGIFKVSFVPDFGVLLNGRRTAIHVWNTKKPEIERRFVYGALSLIPSLYEGLDNAPEDIAVLSLRDGQIYRLSEVGDMTAFGRAVAAAIEGLIEREVRDLGLPAMSPVGIPLIAPPHAP